MTEYDSRSLEELRERIKRMPGFRYSPATLDVLRLADPDNPSYVQINMQIIIERSTKVVIATDLISGNRIDYYSDEWEILRESQGEAIRVLPQSLAEKVYRGDEGVMIVGTLRPRE